MAEKDLKYEDNAQGKFYVDNTCIDCDACRQIAPDNFNRNDEGGYSYVFKQAENEQEAELEPGMGPKERGAKRERVRREAAAAELVADEIRVAGEARDIEAGEAARLAGGPDSGRVAFRAISACPRGSAPTA